MSFIVGDGSGVMDSNAYVTVAYFKAYWLDRGVTITESDTVIEGWIVKATDYADYEYCFLSCAISVEQSLQYPRFSFIDNKGKLWSNNTLPTPLLKGVSELAYILKNNADIEPNIILDGVASRRIGPTSKSFRSGSEKFEKSTYSKADKYFNVISDNQVYTS